MSDDQKKKKDGWMEPVRTILVAGVLAVLLRSLLFLSLIHLVRC